MGNKLISLKKGQYGSEDFEVLEQTTAFQGFFQMLRYRVRHKLFDGSWSGAFSRELFQRGEAAAALLYDPVADKVGLIEQFRIGAMGSEFGPWCLEVVAGMFESGESPESLIKREISEEAGIDKVSLLPISKYYSTPGGCSERIHLYCALCDLTGAEGVYGLDHENEDIRLTIFEPEEVFNVMYESRANNAATLISLQWLAMHRMRLREQYGKR